MDAYEAFSGSTCVFAYSYRLMKPFFYLPKLQTYIYICQSFVDYEIQKGSPTQFFFFFFCAVLSKMSSTIKSLLHAFNQTAHVQIGPLRLPKQQMLLWKMMQAEKDLGHSNFYLAFPVGQLKMPFYSAMLMSSL